MISQVILDESFHHYFIERVIILENDILCMKSRQLCVVALIFLFFASVSLVRKKVPGGLAFWSLNQLTLTSSLTRAVKTATAAAVFGAVISRAASASLGICAEMLKQSRILLYLESPMCVSLVCERKFCFSSLHY